MSYTRVNWNSTTTYVSAENLNVMDKGIKDLDTNIGDVTTLTTTAKTVVPAIKELKTGLDLVNNNLDTASNKLNAMFMGNILIVQAENATNGEGGEILLKGANGYGDVHIDILGDSFRIFNDKFLYAFKADGIYLNDNKIC